eukprot:c1569_g1_i1.p1 GENE.c1569_g1_i1~~c1569_g1_i1.p1  ORF type:complete len:146 (+),score=23.60 c1569_g1_i1:30-467(+)
MTTSTPPQQVVASCGEVCEIIHVQSHFRQPRVYDTNILGTRRSKSFQSLLHGNAKPDAKQLFANSLILDYRDMSIQTIEAQLLRDRERIDTKIAAKLVTDVRAEKERPLASRKQELSDWLTKRLGAVEQPPPLDAQPTSIETPAQ